MQIGTSILLIAVGAVLKYAVTATVSDSIAVHNGAMGFYVQAATTQATLSLVHSVAANNVIGIRADQTGATLRVSQSAITGNTGYGFAALSGGVVASYQDNYIDGNAANAGPLTPISRQ